MATGEKIKIEREKMKERKEKRRRITKKNVEKGLKMLLIELYTKKIQGGGLPSRGA